MKKLKLDELKVQSFVTSLNKDAETLHIKGGQSEDATFCCYPTQLACPSGDPGCTGGGGSWLCPQPTAEGCHYVTAAEDNCSVQYCPTVNASYCNGGYNCELPPTTGGPL